MRYLLILFLFLILLGCDSVSSNNSGSELNAYSELTDTYFQWREFESPPLKDGAPDYTRATFEKRWPEFLELREKLLSIDTVDWPIEYQVDWMIVWAEMNGYEFNYKTLKPWERDPAYYKTVWMARSDVPAHEGPTHHKTLEVWQFDFPLNEKQKLNFIEGLKVIPSLNSQARINLTGNAKDLWVAGIRDIDSQINNLNSLKDLPGISEDPQVIQALEEAISSTTELKAWLAEKSTEKTGPSGIGKENYTWYLQNVHLIPLTWEDEVMILKRELARAWSTLKLEEHRNRNLPELAEANTPEYLDSLNKMAVRSVIDFLDKEEVVTVKPYFEKALLEHEVDFIPKEKRNFFTIGLHYDPRPLYTHFYHWFELARLDTEPHSSEIRKTPLLYNIFDSRNEGTATAVEEMFMHAGLYDDSPRTREIVYIMIAQRAARGLGSLYAHANNMTMEEAGGIHSEFTPRGWMKTEKELLLFEQHLYLRQPGYGTSYITGKYQLEHAMAEFARRRELMNEPFKLIDFFDGINRIGNIPVSLTHWELTGSKDHLFPILSSEK